MHREVLLACGFRGPDRLVILEPRFRFRRVHERRPVTRIRAPVEGDVGVPVVGSDRRGEVFALIEDVVHSVTRALDG